jgi:fimbrial chaperone protein
VANQTNQAGDNSVARFTARNRVISGFILAILTGGVAQAQSLRVMPVNILIPSGQRAATLTVINEGASETAVQIRAYAWDQKDGVDKLTESEDVITSPPIATIAPGASQVVRLVLRRKPEGREATYRILLNQIPVAATPGLVQIVFSMSIPIFAQPATRTAPHLQFHIEMDGGRAYLVAVNDGLRHEAVRNIELSTVDGRKLTTESNASPYVLAGSTRRWPIVTQGSLPAPTEMLRLSAHTDAGTLEQQVHVVSSQ